MDIDITAILSLVLGLIIIMYFLFQPRNSKSPPCISGWIPWFGAAFQFGRAPLEFVEQARIKYGPVFTMYILGNRFTFVSETEDVLAFLRSKEVDLDEAMQQAVKRTVSISKESFNQNRISLFKLLTQQLSSSNMHQFSETLCKEFHEHMEHLGKEGSEDLNLLVRHVMYPTITKTLFGKSFYPTDKSTIDEFERHFQIYDEGFELGSQMPEFFLRNWSKSKTWLLKAFERIATDIKKHKTSESDSKTLMQHVLDNLHGNGAAGYLLLLFWAAQVNAVAGAFWTLAFILSNPSLYKDIMEDIVSVYGKAEKTRIEVVEDDLQKLVSIKRCVLEALRLMAPGAIIRKAMKPLKVKNFIVPAGDLLMASPYWLHRNPKYFPEPEIFKPDRWEEANLEKNAFLDGYLAFGGGKHRCPGRWFALLEIHMLVIMLLYKYQFTLLDPLPKQSLLELVRVCHPAGPFRVQYKLRE
ncbi:24-hydroxycholesterol 7-alpha-hydroxylase-like [Pelodiscus sinensis]|uniref:24-hydroxycholesterol 7-alpha-hydroxylase-like n=1 Tax=Pelodiscus sinensis TaxID=13735 RepID=UPI0003C4BE6B